MNESGSTVGMHAMAHIEAAQREGKTLWAYAREHGLCASHLYRVRRLMQDLPGAPEKARINTAKTTEPPDLGSPFVEVKVNSAPVGPPPRARLWAHLPNGVNVELLCTSADVDLLMAMMDSLGRTPCSASTKV